MRWTKSSDLLPLQNAKAQVQFWEKDILYSQEYLEYVLSVAKQNLKNYPVILQRAKKDVAESQKELYKAKLKLEESEKLE